MAITNFPPLTIEGSIYDAFNTPIPKAIVQVFDKDLRTEQLLGTAETDTDGKYIIIYNRAKLVRSEKARAGVFLRVFADKSLQKKIGESSVHFNLPSKYVLDFKIDGTPFLGLSEFDALLQSVTPLLAGQRVTLSGLNEEDIDFLSAETTIATSILSLLPIAFKNANTKIAPDIFYALFRLQYPTKLNSLLLVQSESLATGIKQAIESNIISKKWEEKIPAIIKAFNSWSSRLILESRDEDKAATQTMMKAVLSTRKLRETFIDTNLATEAKPEKFWKALATKPGFNAKNIADTQNALKLNSLTNQPLVTTALYKLQKRDTDLKEIRDYTKLTISDFEKSIKSSGLKTFPQGIKGKTKNQKIANYAAVLEKQFGELFPTDAFKYRMLQDQDHPFGAAKTDLDKFLSKNQDFDLKTTKPERLFETSDFRGIRNKERIKKQLKKINRVHKIGTNYENTSAILKVGLSSAFDIVQMPKATFVKAIVASGNIAKPTAIKLHKQAVLLDNRTTALATKFKNESDIAMYAMGDTSPDLQSLFGDSSFCDCEHCQSVYSPSAYFVDMLNYMKNEAPDAFDEILNRRPDLQHILLTCKNSNTPLPYIDLVNEVLENQIANPDSVIDFNAVPQTNNTAEELLAFPEHVITDVYKNKLSDTFSSFQLPLDLHLEETRIYLEKLNCKRYELMELFYGKKGKHKYNDVAIAVEYLGLSTNELKVINGENKTAVANVPSNKVSEFLAHTELTYRELLQLLECYFINPTVPNNSSLRTITIIADELDDENKKINSATCNINYLNLKGLDEVTTKQMLRFIRLWKKLDWDILDLDRAFTALGINKVNFDKPADEINAKLIIPLSHISRLKSSYGLTVPEILSLWADIPSETYTDPSKTERPTVTSFYDSLFKNKTISNPLDENFAKPKNLSSTVTLESKSSTITAAYNISESDFNLLNQSKVNQNPIVDGKLSLENLSILYRYNSLAKMLRLKVKELLLLIEMTGIQPFGGTENTLDLFLFIEKVHLIQSTDFSLIELSDLMKINLTAETRLDPNIISEVLAILKEDLQKIDPQFPNADNKLVAQKALITDSLSTVFNTSSEIIHVLLSGVVKFTADDTKTAFFPFIENKEAIASINTNDAIEWTNPDLVNTYTVLYTTWKRLELLMDKFSITAEEFIYFQINEDNLGLTGIWNLPTNNFEQFSAFENLFNLFQFRNKLIQPTEDWYLLFDDSNAKNNFLTKLKSLTNIEETDLVSLTNENNLSFTFPADYLNGKHLVNLIDCNHKVTQLGSTVENTSALTKPDMDNSTALIAKNILKARYEDKEWLVIIKPISNQLRDRKRNALVNYLLTATETDVFRNSNDLFAHFLIDTEMSSCMMTSRIKQAISSVQLFISRCLMGLENGISVGSEFAKQWNEWRKVYRVWEANRKVFLYPENWIEPELRDDKSPFFKELENKLTQNEVTDDTAKDALLEYLEKLDTVANLQIIAFFPDESTKITHVLGRTKNVPHQYFYRKQEKSIWTAWEKVELDIQGDHILLVVWNSRLMVFWGEFTEKQDPTTGTSPLGFDNDGNVAPDNPVPYLEMKLSWSEYKNGSWKSKQISEESVIIKSPHFAIPILSIKTTISLSSLIIKEKLIIRIFRQDFGALRLSLHKAFCFDNCNNSPFITSPKINTLNWSIGTLLNNMLLNEVEGRLDDRFLIYNTGLYKQSGENGNLQKIVIFNKTPGKSQLLPNHHEIEKSKPVQFFYNNEENTFYVEPHQIFIKDTFVGDVQVTDSVVAMARSFNNPSPMGTFTNNTGRMAFEVKPGTFVNNFSDLDAMPTPPNNITPFKKGYSFQTFYHPFVCDYIKALNTEGIDALYKEKIQNKDDVNLFTAKKYAPNSTSVIRPYPVEKVDFSLSGAYSIYNWELFFHIPLLIATRLSQNQKFDEARKWFHYIFDPTKSIDLDSEMNEGAKRFWITKPFKDQIDNQQNLSIEDLINQESNSGELKLQLQNWQDNPFNPHAIARFRKSAYMRSTVMKYIDNLMAWGDQLFRRDSIESINEATLLYVLAANLLGEKPENIPNREKPVDSTFNSIEAALNPFNTAKVAIESFLKPADTNESSSDAPITMPLFCLPKNSKLLKYWDTVADKLFKIRHCMNIEGVVRQLPLFEPPIDPALLIRARAAGLDLNSVLNDINATLPNYRFQVMLQKANELCNDVKSLGSQLLSALEKKDAEELSLLRSGQESKLLELMRDVKKKQVDEANENLDALKCSEKVVEERKNYYSTRPFKNNKESFHLHSLKDAARYQKYQGANEVIASILFTVPDVTVGAWSWGAKSGGTHAAGASKAISTSLGALSNFEMTQGNIASVEGGFVRRKEDWDFQTETAKLELKQIEKQIISSEIRLAIAEKDLSNHEVQMEQAKKLDDYMRGKFTNAELYNYMITQISGIYFQTYQMAYDYAKKAEKCYQFELGITGNNLIKFGHWDSLKKGLLSGEKLQFDLRRLESSFFEDNQREFELSKQISLKLIDPLALIKLREKGKCEFSLLEELFDLDYPGHYFRRVKSVSISLPCIAGPYTTVACTLSLTKNDIRIYRGSQNPDSDNQYKKNLQEDDRFIQNNIPVKSIATSSAQNDSGVFELNFRDERYLPFEGAGAVSSWTIDLFNDDDPATDFGKPLRQFNYDTISDAIIHVKYTAREGTKDLKQKALANLKNLFEKNSTTPNMKIINLKHDFPSEWHKFLNPDDPASDNQLDFALTSNHFPYRDSEHKLKINTITAIAKSTKGGAYTIKITAKGIALEDIVIDKSDDFGGLHYAEKDVSGNSPILDFTEENNWEIVVQTPAGQGIKLEKNELKEMYLILGYEWED